MDIIVIIAICLLIACLAHYMGKKYEDACNQLAEMRDHARANPPQCCHIIHIPGPFTYDKARSTIGMILDLYEQDNNVRIEALSRDREGKLQIDARPVRDA